MTRLRRLVARAVVLALLLLTIGGGIATADSSSAVGDGLNFPDDPGYEL